MAAHPFGAAASTLLFNGLEHSGEVHRIVTGSRQNLSAQQICLSFILPAEFQKIGSQSHLRALRDDVTRAAANDGSENCAADRPELYPYALGLGCLRGSMPQ